MEKYFTTPLFILIIFMVILQIKPLILRQIAKNAATARKLPHTVEGLVEVDDPFDSKA